MKECSPSITRPNVGAVRKCEPQEVGSHFLNSTTNKFRTTLAVPNASVKYLLDVSASLSRTEVREPLQSMHLIAAGDRPCGVEFGPMSAKMSVESYFETANRSKSQRTSLIH